MSALTVSFDLDDTLFVDPEKYDTEKKLPFPLDKIFKERLRAGTVELLSKIRENDIELWIYTTSFRTPRYITALFRCYGIKIDEVVNGDRHYREVQSGRAEAMPSKYPSKYRIDLHIDDDISVLQNGKTYGFKVAIINDESPDWVNDIWAEIEKIKRIKDKTVFGR